MNNELINKKIYETLEYHKNNKILEAQKGYEDILKIDENNFDANHLLGVLMIELQNYDRAEILLKKSIKINPKIPNVFNNYGILLRNIKKFNEALINFKKAIELYPDYLDAINNYGNILYEIGNYEEAINFFNKVLKLKNDYAEAYNNRANCYKELNYIEEALQDYDLAIKYRNSYLDPYHNKAYLLFENKNYKESIMTCNLCLTINSKNYHPYYILGLIYEEIKDFEKSIENYQKAYQLKHDSDYTLGALFSSKMSVCDWKDFENLKNSFEEKINKGLKICTSFQSLHLSSSINTQKKLALLNYDEKYIRNNNFNINSNNKIKIGYFSSDFYTHATSQLITGMLQEHNKDEFELYGFNLNSEYKDDSTEKISEAINLIDITNYSLKNIKKIISDIKIDIAVDLKGFTKNSKPEIFYSRVAPVQINYLGHPGTLGPNHCDYIIADKIVIPEYLKNYYYEKIIYLPNSYQVNDDKQQFSVNDIDRTMLGLNKNSFLIGCFNSIHKITPDIFKSWVKILQNINDSLIILITENNLAKENLKKEFLKNNISEERLLFWEKVKLEEHLSRLKNIDLFLDTCPYNAHTTANDALFAGVPIITLIGETFASRVAASLLNALDLNELVCKNLDEYEKLAITLGNDKEKLTKIKNKLKTNKNKKDLFKTKIFTENIEKAYIKAYERYKNNLLPDHIYIS